VQEIAIGQAVSVVVNDAKGEFVHGADVVVRPDHGGRDYPAGTTAIKLKVGGRWHDRKVGELPMYAPAIQQILRPDGKTTVNANRLLAYRCGAGHAGVPLKPSQTEVKISLQPGVPDPKAVIKAKREAFADKGAPAGDWDWLHAPLTTIREPWIYASLNSASIYWQTDGRAWGYVEYGRTKEYGSTSAASDTPSFAQLHHLSGLEAGVEYHYRMASVGVNGERVVSDDRKFITRRPPGKVILWPDEVGKRADKLLEGDATYVVTKPIAGGCLRPIGKNITIDLNGHEWPFTGGVKGRIFRGVHTENLRFCNGIVRDERLINGVLSTRLPKVKQIEVYGLTLDATSGIGNYRGPAYIHHCRLSHPPNTRPGGGCEVTASNSRICHNIFPNATASAIRIGRQCKDVEIFGNVFELNTWRGKYGLGAAGSGARIHDNVFIARGEKPLAIVGFAGNRIYNNRFDVMVDAYPRRAAVEETDGDEDIQDAEEADDGTAAQQAAVLAGGVAFRLDGSATGLEFRNNTVVVRGAQNPELAAGGNAYGIWFDKAGMAGVVKGNVIVTVPGRKGVKAVAATTDGRDDATSSLAGANRVVKGGQ